MPKFIELEAGQNIEEGDYMPHKPDGRTDRVRLFRCSTCEAVLFAKQLKDHECASVSPRWKSSSIWDKGGFS